MAIVERLGCVGTRRGEKIYLRRAKKVEREEIGKVPRTQKRTDYC